MENQITIDFLDDLFRKYTYGENKNIIFSNTAYNGKTICTCGNVLTSYSYDCPQCKTINRICYTNRSSKPANITAAIYYAVSDIDDKNFMLTRYDLVYVIDENTERIEKILKEHSKLHYNHDAEKVYLNINGKKTTKVTKMGKYTNRTITRVFGEVKKVMACRDFF